MDGNPSRKSVGIPLWGAGPAEDSKSQICRLPRGRVISLSPVGRRARGSAHQVAVLLVQVSFGISGAPGFCLCLYVARTATGIGGAPVSKASHAVLGARREKVQLLDSGKAQSTRPKAGRHP